MLFDWNSQPALAQLQDNLVTLARLRHFTWWLKPRSTSQIYEIAGSPCQRWRSHNVGVQFMHTIYGGLSLFFSLSNAWDDTTTHCQGQQKHWKRLEYDTLESSSKYTSKTAESTTLDLNEQLHGAANVWNACRPFPIFWGRFRFPYRTFSNTRWLQFREFSNNQHHSCGNTFDSFSLTVFDKGTFMSAEYALLDQESCMLYLLLPLEVLVKPWIISALA